VERNTQSLLAQEEMAQQAVLEAQVQVALIQCSQPLLPLAVVAVVAQAQAWLVGLVAAVAA
jgi:hypothetical protein